jgi:hypothetical protein
MKRRKPKSKSKRKLKGNSEQKPSTVPQKVLTRAVERKQPANTVELQAERQDLASVVEPQTEIESSTASVEPREETAESASFVVAPQIGHAEIPRDEEPTTEIEHSVAPVETRKETEGSATVTVEPQSERAELPRDEETQIENSATSVEHRDETEDAASTVELRGQIEDLESVIDIQVEVKNDIQVEVENSSSPAEIREATGTPPGPPEVYSSTEIPTSPVAMPADTEKPAPQQSAPRTAADRRAHPRYAFTAAIEIVAAEPEARIKSQVRDLSQQGCYVDTGTPLTLGTATDLRITKGATIFEASARVVYNQTGKGMGLMFIAVEPQSRRTLDTWIVESRESSWRAANRRRSQRVLMKVPVRVSGQAADGASFEVETHTLSISPHGALLVLAPVVHRGQRFILANMQTKSALECVVAHLEPSPGAPTQVGVEFSLPNPAFWRVAFPPKDWTPRHPDAKSR